MSKITMVIVSVNWLDGTSLRSKSIYIRGKSIVDYSKFNTMIALESHFF